MLTELCKELRNWFETDKVFDSFTIANGLIDLTGIVQDGQYFRIIGSVFNDGVYQYPIDTKTVTLQDETFSGAIWPMAVPPSVIQLASEIGEWVGKYNDISQRPYTSENMPKYGYSKAIGNNGAGVTWQDMFDKRLNQWRKI